MLLPSVITGVGLRTCLGRDLDATWNSLLAGRAIIDHQKIDVGHGPDSLRIDILASSVAADAVQQARWPAVILEGRRTALIVGTSKGPIEDWIESRRPTSDKPSLRMGLADTAITLAAAMGVGGPVMTVSAACASGLVAMFRAALMLTAGEVDRVLVVAAEASVHPLFTGSFKRLGVTPPPGCGSRPFDPDRAGFLMSDAAAAICLERDGPKGLPVVDRIEIGSDATHLTGSDPAGRSLSRLIGRAMDDEPIDLVHAHGTGTQMNDDVEWRVLDRMFAGRTDRPNIYSHKASLGHSLGAAGLVSVVLSTRIHRAGIVPPNPNTRDVATDSIQLTRLAVRRAISCSLLIAAGFGGPAAVARIRTPRR